jgi:transcriptional regulator with XRE-family HTH domain
MKADASTDLTVNQRIKLLREEMGLNQRDFAAQLAASHGLIAGIETGKPVNPRLVKLIASEFGVSEAWLSSGRGQMFAHEEDAEFTRLLNAYKELPPRYQELIFKMIEVLRKDDAE